MLKLQYFLTLTQWSETWQNIGLLYSLLESCRPSLDQCVVTIAVLAKSRTFFGWWEPFFSWSSSLDYHIKEASFPSFFFRQGEAVFDCKSRGTSFWPSGHGSGFAQKDLFQCLQASFNHRQNPTKDGTHLQPHFAWMCLWDCLQHSKGLYLTYFCSGCILCGIGTHTQFFMSCWNCSNFSWFSTCLLLLLQARRQTVIAFV